MKLGTHAERIAALENAAETADPLVLATLVQLAAHLEQEDARKVNIYSGQAGLGGAVQAQTQKLSAAADMSVKQHAAAYRGEN